MSEVKQQVSQLPHVLYVDDESKSLKYFEKIFGSGYQVSTATSAQEGIDILDEQGDSLTVLLVDQRMPMRPGVDVLTRAREKFPHITRIMTTAYSDIDSAVRAINEGQVFRYVTKPWDLEHLREILKLGVEENRAFQVRDLSVDDRVELAKRLVVADRVENLRRSAECVSWRLRSSIASISAFTKIMLIELEKGIEESGIEERRQTFLELGKIANREISEVTNFLQKLLLISKSGGDFSPTKIFAKTLIDGWISRAQDAYSKKGVDFKIHQESENPYLFADEKLLLSAGETVLKVMSKLIDHDTSISVKCQETSLKGQNGITIKFRLVQGTWEYAKWKSMFDPFGKSADYDYKLDLLSAFFVIYQHGGEISVDRDFDEGSGVDFFLPFNANNKDELSIENGGFERIWEQFTGTEANN